MGWIDVHTHLDMLEEGVEAALQNAKAAHVDHVVTIGTEPGDHQFVLDVSEKYYPQVYCTLGVHPHHGAVWTSEIGDFIIKNHARKTVIAIGEIGLDYYYNQSPAEAQKASFASQLDLACQLDLPVEIHTRDAEKDTVDILKSFNGKVNGLIHCFTGTKWLAQECLDLGFHISFSGVVTFKNAQDLRETCKFVPLDRIHVETDAPFLSPVPVRGKKNSPAHVIHTAKMVADLHLVSEELLCKQTNENARQLFKKII